MHRAHRGRAARRPVTLGIAVGAALALLSAPGAAAEPVEPPEPGEPAPLVLPEAAPVALPEPAPAGLAEEVALSAPPAEGVPHIEGVPHLPSPENLPPGTSATPPPERRLEGLRDIWEAVQNKEMTKSDALLLLITQRPRAGDDAPLEAMTPQPQDPAALVDPLLVYPLPATPPLEAGVPPLPAPASDVAPVPALPMPSAP